MISFTAAASRVLKLLSCLLCSSVIVILISCSREQSSNVNECIRLRRKPTHLFELYLSFCYNRVDSFLNSPLQVGFYNHQSGQSMIRFLLAVNLLNAGAASSRSSFASSEDVANGWRRIFINAHSIKKEVKSLKKEPLVEPIVSILPSRVPFLPLLAPLSVESSD